MGEPKPELLDDWDQRLVVTTVKVNEEGTSLTLKQMAEKDQVRFILQYFKLSWSVVVVCQRQYGGAGSGPGRAGCPHYDLYSRGCGSLEEI